jgi:diaminopimelate decarboxylase
VALSLEAETHPHLRTAGRRAKFGFTSASLELWTALDAVIRSRWLTLSGLHVHLGSQITDAGIYRRAAERLIEIAESVPEDNLELELSVGGGWAVAYRSGDPTLDAACVAEALAPAFAAHDGFHASVEPGRSLVARSAMAVYRVGSVKERDGVRIVAVDGGMGDNPRPALYGARYAAILPDRPLDAPDWPADIVGRYCESGDVLAHHIALPAVATGDLVCIPVSGAYQVSMASAYNLVPQPPVIVVCDGQARLLTRRATHDDLFAREV